MITVKNVSKKYGSFYALKNISFEVKKGEILGFLGPNGAGKTTTMKIITGFFPPTSGIVEIAGVDLGKSIIGSKKKIGYLPENVPLYHELTVMDFLKFVANIKGVNRKEVQAHLSHIIADCALGLVENKLIGNLSKGYRQRVGLAQALVGDPEIIILDEPTVGLDPKQIIEIRNLIKQMAGKKTIVLSSHILHEVSMLSDRVIVINNGEIIASDTPEELNKKLKTTDTLSLLLKGEKDKILEVLQSIKGVISSEYIKNIGDELEFSVHSDKGKDLRAEIIKVFSSISDVVLLELSTVTMTLEDIFLKLINQEEDISE